MTQTTKDAELPLKQRGFQAADMVDKLSKRTSHPIDKELFAKITDVVRHLSNAIPDERPNLRVVK